MIFKEAFISLKKDKVRSFFYFLTLLLTECFIYIFFTISFSDRAGFHVLYADNNMVTFLTVIVITICMIVAALVNDFFIKNKSSTMAIYLTGGATYFQLASYLLIQMLFILLVSLPLSFFIINVLRPLLNKIFITGFRMNFESLIATIVILSVLSAGMVLLNLGFAYRMTIYNLLNETKSTIKRKIPFPFEITIKQKTKNILIILMFIFSITQLYISGNDKQGFLFACLIGLISFYFMLEEIMIPYINTKLKQTTPIKLITLGYLRHDIRKNKFYIMLYLVSQMLFISIMAASASTDIEKELSYISLIMINLLLLLSLSFKYSASLSMRIKELSTLRQCGYNQKQLRQIIFKQVTNYFGLLFICSFFFMINIFISMLIHDLLAMEMVLSVLIMTYIPFLIVYGLVYLYYDFFTRKTISQK